MTKTAIARTTEKQSSTAGRSLAEQLQQGLGAGVPDAVILFASPIYDHSALLESLIKAAGPTAIVGCSSSGEFTSHGPLDGSACALGLSSSEMRFRASVGTRLRQDRASAAREMVSGFTGSRDRTFRYRSALVLTDALAGYMEEFLEDVTMLTGGTYQLFGGGAGDDAQFSKTYVFCGRGAHTDACVALEILSSKPLGIGVSHGWIPASDAMRVTDSDGVRINSINATSAVEVLQEHAENTGQHFDPADPMPFFLHNIIGIDTGHGYKLRVPLTVEQGGAIQCAAEVPTGAKICIMRATIGSSGEAAANASRAAMKQLNGEQPAAGLFFDCAATRLRMGRDFGVELAEVTRALDSAPYAGCNTYGQLARIEGQFSGFHNCTAVVCAIPR